MRVVLAILIGVMLAGIYGGYSWLRESEGERDASVRRAAGAVEQIEREIRIRAATGGVEVNGRGWPKMIDVGWWRGNPPQNPLVPGDRPWLEIAGEDEGDLEHPPVRQSVRRAQAAFWYNPATGRVRARVGPAVSDRVALELYNRVNGTQVAELFDTLWEPENGDSEVVAGETGADGAVDESGTFEVESVEGEGSGEEGDGVRVTRGDSDGE